MEKILHTALQWKAEPLHHGLGFKGGALGELWQICCEVHTDGGLHATGLGVQSVLWSDSGIFAAYGAQRGNELMLSVTRRALEMLEGQTLTLPSRMLDDLLPEIMAYAKNITGRETLRKTFVLNALTPVDWALWKLYRQTQPEGCFADLVAPVTRYLSCRQRKMGNIPLISYDTPESQIRALAEEGRSLFKIKIGANPGMRNDPEEMLAQDLARLKQIHGILHQYETEQTQWGHPAYYLDANGRYDSLSRMQRFLDGADRMGALPGILLLEEPFPEDALCPVGALGVRVAGDESAHGAGEAAMLMDEYGYSAIALKPIAKTLSATLQVLEAAGKRNVPCFCADLTVNPKMVEENKLFAAHLPLLPGMHVGVFESNGGQNYRNWQAMCRDSGVSRLPWARMEQGMYSLEEPYFARDGGIWED